MKKIISSILAVSFIVASCAMNVMAATTERTMTVSVDKATDLVAGDIVTVEVKLSNNANVNSCGYRLLYDSNIFEFDTTLTSDEIPASVDVDWYFDGILKTRGAWFKALGAPTENYTSSFAAHGWAGSAGVASSDENYVIGKFTLKVKEGVTVSSYDLTLSNDANHTYVSTMGENSGDPLTIVPATVTFKATEPTVTPWEVTITDGSQYANGYIWKADTAKGDGNLTKFDVTFTDSESNTLTRSILSSDKSGTFDWNTATTFYVGLKTARTGVTAAWDIAAKDGEKDVPVTLK